MLRPAPVDSVRLANNRQRNPRLLYLYYMMGASDTARHAIGRPNINAMEVKASRVAPRSLSLQTASAR
jgi:hypothetical protein